MGKTLCKLDKLLKQDFEAYCQLVDRPNFVCKKCGRAANEKKFLCKGQKLKR